MPQVEGGIVLDEAELVEGRQENLSTGRGKLGSQRIAVDVLGGPVLDRAALVAMVEGDMSLLSDMVETFVNEYPALEEAVRAAVAAGDAAAIRHAAHALKGAVSIFSVQPAYEKAQQLERMGRTNDLGQSAEVFAALEAIMGPVMREFPSLLVQIRSGC